MNEHETSKKDGVSLDVLERAGKLLDSAPMPSTVRIWLDGDIQELQKDSRGVYRKVRKTT